MKVSVIGGGSTYTPELVSGLAQEAVRLPVDELVLMDTSAERREVVGGLAGRILRRQGFTGRLTVTDSLEHAVDGAHAVLLQLRVGGQAARLHDETVPARCGCVGQETTGAGGLGKAMRTIPVVLAIAEEVNRRAAPGAWLIDFTNPVGIVTRALRDAGHPAIGLCNVAIGLQRKTARLLEVAPERVLVDQVGLNHLTWIRRVLLDGADVLPDLLSRFLDVYAEELELPAQLIAQQHALPSYYLRYFYAEEDVLAEQRESRPRAAVVADIEEELLRLYRDPNLDTKPAALEQRGGAFYSEAATQLLASLVTGAGDVQVVDVPNLGAIPGLADDDVVEAPARIDSAGAHLLRQPALAPDMLGLVQHVAAYERLAVRAATTREPADVRRALLCHPLVGQWDKAALLTELIPEQVEESAS
jgi:6-phospho-beta-glucosidase